MNKKYLAMTALALTLAGEIRAQNINSSNKMSDDAVENFYKATRKNKVLDFYEDILIKESSYKRLVHLYEMNMLQGGGITQKKIHYSKN